MRIQPTSFLVGSIIKQAVGMKPMDRTRWDYITTYGRTRITSFMVCFSNRFSLPFFSWFQVSTSPSVPWSTSFHWYIIYYRYIYICLYIIYNLILYISCTPSTGHPLDHFLKLRPTRGPFGHRGLRRVAKHQARFANSLGPKVRRQTSAEMASSRGSSKWGCQQRSPDWVG